MTRGRALAIGVAAAAGTTFVSGLALRRPGALDLTAGTPAFVVLLLLGLRVAMLLPGHPVGWMLLGLGAADGVGTLADGYARAGLLDHRPVWLGARAALIFGNASWLLAFGGLACLTLVFPDGSVSGPRRRIALLGAPALLGAWIGAVLQPGAFDPPYQHFANPIGVPWVGSAPGEALVACFMFGVLAVLIATGWNAVTRFLRAAGEERAQLKLLAFAYALVPLTLGACFILQLLWPRLDFVTIAFDLAIVAVPTAAAAAVLRFHLYGVDRLISRTVTYFALSALLALIFAATALGVGAIVGRHSSVAASAGTLAAVLAFRPLHRRVGIALDRRLDRRRYDALSVIDAFLDDLHAGRVDPERLPGALADALGDPGLRLSIAGPGGSAQLIPSGSVQLRQDLVREVLTRVSLAVEVLALRAELRATLAEVNRSRERIVAASYEERRRLERDLHDGAQQRLVSLGLSLARIRKSLPGEARVLEPALQRAVDEITAALSDMRRLASGVRPSRLDEGLAAALSDLARSAEVPVELRADLGRAPQKIEDAAYFIACEGVTNAVRHSGAERITVEAAQQDDELLVVVSDDGVGGARIEAGRGLAGLADRVAAHGGTLRLESSPGAGTRMEVRLPCG